MMTHISEGLHDFGGMQVHGEGECSVTQSSRGGVTLAAAAAESGGVYSHAAAAVGAEPPRLGIGGSPRPPALAIFLH